MLDASPLVGARFPRPGASHAHVESYFLKANDPHARRAIWIKTTIYASRGAAIAEAWAIAFDADKGHVAVKASVPFDRARFSRDALDACVTVGDGAGDSVVLRPHESRGAIESGDRRVAWDLALSSDGIPLVPFPHAWMYEAKFPSSKLVSPFPDLRATGSVTVNGETWNVDRWPGLLGHNWGPRHAPVYAWGHSNMWERADGKPEPELVFEGVSGRVKVGPVLSPVMTLLCLRWRGVRYDLNAAGDWLANRGTISPHRWVFEGHGRHVSLRGEMWASTEDFVGLHYDNPYDVPTHCLNSKLASARLEITASGRAPFEVRSRAAALEIGTTDPTHGVRMYA
jgi:hypothetical protein